VDALRGLKIGSVKYLNARPLVHTCTEPVLLQHPSELAASLAAGKLDAALVPVFELFRHPGYVLVDNVAIASDGPVYSVFLAFRGDLANVQRVALDPASLTSVHLIKVILSQFHGIEPEYIAGSCPPPGNCAMLLIGNQAIEYRKQMDSDVQIMDLGAEWKSQTGLPFVYAAWLLRPDLPRIEEIGEAFRTLKQEGLEHLEEIIAMEQQFSPEFAREYLTQHIRFDLGAREKEGLAKYRALLRKQGFIDGSDSPLKFV
jgi:chorismate dehydratase